MSGRSEMSQYKATMFDMHRTIDAATRATQPDLPDRIFHYTTSTGLASIISSNVLWATHYRFLNDSSEMEYGRSLFLDYIKSLNFPDESTPVGYFIQQLLVMDELLETDNRYVACFCEKDDLLNQWRNYTNSSGYAIGFRTKDIVEDTDADYSLRKVIYDLEVQKKLIAGLVDLAISNVEKFSSGKTVDDVHTFVILCCAFVQTEVEEYSSMFKHPAFEVEHEWRLSRTHSGKTNDTVHFRVGPYGLTPYILLNPCAADGPKKDKLPLAVITHSPTKDPENVRFAVKMLLESNGYDLPVNGSILPIRSS